MQVETTLYLLTSVLLTVLMRITTRPSREKFGILYMLRDYQRNISKATKKYSYPPLYYWILSKWPKKQIQKDIILFNPLIEGVNVALLFILTLTIPPHNPLTALAISVCYAVIPVLVIDSIIIIERPLSVLLFNLFMVSLIANAWPLTLTLGILILLAHKFASQLMAIMLISLTIVTGNPFYLLTLLIILGSTYSLFPNYRNTLQSHYHILLFWFRNIQKRGHSTKKALSKLLLNPFIIPALVVSLFAPTLFISIWFISIWFKVTLYCAILTSFTIYAFMGENHRYLQYGVIPSLILTSLIYDNFLLLIITLYVCSSILTLITTKKIKNSQLPINQKKLKELTTFLNKLKKTKVITETDWNGVLRYKTKHDVLYSQEPREWHDNQYHVFNTDLLNNLKQIATENHVKLIITYRKNIKLGKKIFDNKEFKVYQLE